MGLPFEAAWQLTQQFGERFPIDPALQQWLDQVRCPLPPLPAHRELIAAADLQQPLSDGRQLLAHQRAGVRWLLARGAVLADEMGLGKTLTALAAARALLRCSATRLLVVAPVGLHDHWRREALALQLSPELLSWARLPRSLPMGVVCWWWMRPISPRTFRPSAPRPCCVWRGIHACGRFGC